MIDRDTYAEGWAEGIRQARVIVMGARTLEAAREALEGLLVVDHRHRAKRARDNRTRKGLVR